MTARQRCAMLMAVLSVAACSGATRSAATSARPLQDEAGPASWTSPIGSLHVELPQCLGRQRTRRLGRLHRGRVFRTVDGGATWTADTVPGAARLDFRGIRAFDREHRRHHERRPRRAGPGAHLSHHRRRTALVSRVERLHEGDLPRRRRVLGFPPRLHVQRSGRRALRHPHDGRRWRDLAAQLPRRGFRRCCRARRHSPRATRSSQCREHRTRGSRRAVEPRRGCFARPIAARTWRVSSTGVRGGRERRPVRHRVLGRKARPRRRR